MNTVVLNGDLIDKNLASVAIDNKGYFFDYCVYSSLKAVKGNIFFPNYHAERIIQSANLLGIKHDLTNTKLELWLHKLVKTVENKDVFLRMVLVGDPDGILNADLYIYVVGSLTFYPDKFYRKGVKTITYLGERPFPQAKSKDLLVSVMAYSKAKKAGALDALLVDRNGDIREGTRTNFFGIKGNQIVTAPENIVLGGIVQKIVLDLAKIDFEIVRENISLANIHKFDEFFMTSTSMNVMPVNQIDQIILRSEFSKTKQIQKLFKNYIKTYTREN